MRQTIGEQLGGTCRILEVMIAPEVAGTPAGDVLGGLVKNLRMLQTSWTAVLPFLHWDNETTASLLMRAASSVPDALAQRIVTSLDSQLAPDPIDVTAVQECNDELRALLTEVIHMISTESDTHAEIIAHLAARSARYPLRAVPDLPQAQLASGPAPKSSC
jgi:hypothetical protein